MNWTRIKVLMFLVYSVILFTVWFYLGYIHKGGIVVPGTWVCNQSYMTERTTTTTIEYYNTSSEMTGIDLNDRAIMITNVSMFYNRTIDYSDIILNFSMTHEWKHFYNCENGSIDLSKELNKAGYESGVECGYYYNGCDPDTDHWQCRHCWVSLNLKIEPFEGKILTVNEFKEYGI